MGRNELALTQYRKGLEINSRNPFFRREEAFHLNRVGRVDEAIVKIESILADNPNDIDTISYLGRIYKEMWMDSWKWVSNHEKRLQTAFNSYHWLIKAIDTYMRGYRVNLNNDYPAVNALTLSTILIDLANRYGDPENRVPEIEKVDSDLEELRGSLLFALETFSDEEKADYWTLVSMAELKVLTAKETDEVARAYRKALTASRRNVFFLQSSLVQLEMFTALEIRPEFVEAGVQVITDELSRIRKEEIAQKTGKPGNGGIEAPKDRTGGVFVFTGYMISNPAKNENQFPPEKEEDIKNAIHTVLAKYNAGPDNLAITSGMGAGSEIIFVECCTERGIPVRVYFPCTEVPYVHDFVSPGGDQWVERFFRLRNHPLVDEFFQPEQVGLPREGDNIYERNNRWALYSAFVRRIDEIRLVALWDGKTEPSNDLDAYLVKHMIDLMRDAGGVIEHISPYKVSLSPTAFDDSPEYPAEGTIIKKKRASKRKS
jgi:tetratricopeptide (TPR) repeat protein